MDEWEFIFDFRVREVTKDQLTLVDMGLLFFLAKNITNKEFMENTQPELYKDFLYKDLSKIKFLYVKEKQIGRLIDKLVNAGYIKTQKIFGGVSVALTFKYFNSISPKQFNEPDNQKYLSLLNWSKMSKLAFENGQKCPSFDIYYKSNIKNNNIYNINNNSLNTVVVNSNSSNIINPLISLFEKYPQFETKQQQLLPANFNVDKLIDAVTKSEAYLQKKADLEFLLSNYAKIITGFYNDKPYRLKEKEEHRHQEEIRRANNAMKEQEDFDEFFINFANSLSDKDREELRKAAEEEKSKG